MRRRIFLRGTAACLGGAVASAFGIDGRVVDAQEAAPTVVDAELTVRDSGCGDGSQRATVRADAAADRVTVDGVVAAPSACYTAELAGAAYDDGADALDLTVRTVEREDVDLCVQCLTAIEYRAVVTFDGGLPGRAVVHHDDETVTESALDAAAANWRQSAFDAANTAVDATGRGPDTATTVRWTQDDVRTAPAIVDQGVGGSAGESGSEAGATGSSDGDELVGSGDGSVAFVGASGGGVSALDGETGDERWSFDAVGPLAGTPAVVDGTVYAAGTDGHVVAVDAVTGDTGWNRSVDSSVAAAPTVTGGGGSRSTVPGTVYVVASGSSTPGRIIAIDTGDGTVRWTRESGGNVRDPLAITEDLVYVGRSDGRLLALSPEDGQRQWERRVGDETANVTAPAVRDGLAYLAARTENEDGPGGRVFAFDAASGESEWTRDLGTSAVPRSLAVADGTVVASAAAYGEVALSDGAGGTQSGGDTDMSAAGGSVHALNASNGDERWSRTTTAEVTAGPTIAGGTAYVPLNGGIAAVALDDGGERFTTSFPARVTAPATPAAGRLYLAVDDDRLVALGPAESEGPTAGQSLGDVDDRRAGNVQ